MQRGVLPRGRGVLPVSRRPVLRGRRERARNVPRALNAARERPQVRVQPGVVRGRRGVPGVHGRAHVRGGRGSAGAVRGARAGGAAGRDRLRLQRLVHPAGRVVVQGLLSARILPPPKLLRGKGRGGAHPDVHPRRLEALHQAVERVRASQKVVRQKPDAPRREVDARERQVHQYRGGPRRTRRRAVQNRQLRVGGEQRGQHLQRRDRRIVERWHVDGLPGLQLWRGVDQLGAGQEPEADGRHLHGARQREASQQMHAKLLRQQQPQGLRREGGVSVSATGCDA
mmetsp:Transcript_12495/g.30319  ORF Transcript_12495/g.30319 Transcript_12495/m.30319 type:complete len:284 (-) Transcript_12495:118-969(-)